MEMDAEISKRFAEFALNNYFQGKQANIARKLSISESTVTRWLRGDTVISRENLDKLSEATGIPVEKILKGQFATPLERPHKMMYVGGVRTLYSESLPPELAAAIQWHVSHGVDQESAQLAAAKAWESAPPDETPSAVQWALRLQDWLRQIADLR